MARRPAAKSRAEMIESGGFLNFIRAVRFAARYGVVCKQAGDLLTMTEYAHRFGLSRSQAFREQAAWRACMGDVSVLDVLDDEVLSKHGYTEDQREAAIARQLMEGEAS